MERLNLHDFMARFDIPGAVILLEGKRNVAEADAPQLEALGRMLATRMQHAIFRSGNASGADALFAAGVASVNPARLEVILPFKGHRSKYNLAGTSHALDELNIAAEPQVIYESKLHKGTAGLVERYLDGVNNPYTIKATYILRDTVKVLGTAGIPPAFCAIFYDDLSNPRQGGTGHTIAVCERNGIPFCDQRIWTQWLP
jgi:hypothetical protein